MKKSRMLSVAGILILSMLAAGCGSGTVSSSADEAAESSTASAAAAASTAAEAATAAAAVEEDEEAWKEMDDAYLSGIRAADYVSLPEKYSRLHVEAEKPEDPTDDDVEAWIEQDLQSRTTTEESSHKHVRDGDIVSIDYVGKINGEEFDGGSGSYDLEIGSHSFIDGFEEGLIGAEKGETLDLALTFPEDYGAEDLAGQDVVFTVTVNAISKRVTPELTDDFVKSLNLTNAFGQAVTTVEDYREYVRSNLIESNEAAYENTVKSQVLSKIVDESVMLQDPPENLVEKYNYLLTRQLNYYALQYYMDLQTLMETYYGATADNYEQMIRDMAVEYARQGLVLQAVADAEDLNPDEDEITTAITEYAESDATIESADDLERLIRELLRDQLMTEKAIDWLYDHCKVEEPSEAEDAETADTADTAAAAEEDAEAADTAAAAEEDAEAAGTADTAAAAEEDAEAADTADTAAAAEEDAKASDTGDTAAAAGEDDKEEDSAARHEN